MEIVSRTEPHKPSGGRRNAPISITNNRNQYHTLIGADGDGVSKHDTPKKRNQKRSDDIAIFRALVLFSLFSYGVGVLMITELVGVVVTVGFPVPGAG